jgi:Arc/MetJ family transcription regulator
VRIIYPDARRWVVAKTLLDVDEDLLAEASTALGTRTKKDTVNEALRQAVEVSRERRRRALESLRRIADEGGFDFDRLPELDQ